MNYRRVILIYCLFPLLAGSLIYLFLRSDTWLHDRLFAHDTRLPLLNIKGRMADILKFQVPDFCWSFSLSAALLLWKMWWGRPVPFFTGFLLLLAAGSELIQLGVISGFTFDNLDLLAAVSGAFLSILLIHQYENN